MEDKIYLFTIKDKDGKVSKYATACTNQMEAEYLFDDEISNNHDNINYLVQDVDIYKILEDKSIIWF